MRTRQTGWTSGLTGDSRLAVRSLLKHPAHSLVAVATLAVAAGAATAVFSVVNVVVLRPLPYPDAHELVLVRDASPPRFPSFSVSPGRFVEWQARARAYDGFAATSNGSVSLTGDGDPERLAVAYVSATLFDVLGVQPAIGRGFTADEDRAAGSLAVVLSHGLWQARFGGRRDAVGETITIDDNPVQVVGVMPEGFDYPSEATRVWMPLRLSDEDRRRYGSHYLRVIARVSDGASVAQAREDLVRAARELEAEIPDGNATWTVLVDPLHDYTIRDVRAGLLLLVAAAAGVLLIACANVAGLLIARAADRQREVAIRAALGASRLRLVRQLLIESAMLGVAGAALGVLVAAVTLRLLLAAPWTRVPRMTEVPLDPAALAFAAVLALVTPLIFGLLPALQLSRTSGRGALAAGGRTGASSMRAGTRSALIVGEIALAVMLVAGSGLLLRSLQRLMDVDPGFQPEHVLAVSVSLPQPRYPAPEDRSRFFAEFVERARALPGVTAAAVSQASPFLGDYVASITLEAEQVEPEMRPSANFYAVSPGYFETMGIPMLEGRDFTDADRAEGPRVAIVSRKFADRLLPGREPLGRRFLISQGPRDDYAEIVGVVGDVRQYGLDEEATLQVYEPARQHPYFGSNRLLLRAAVPPETLTSLVRQLVLELDPRLPIANAVVLEQAVADSTGSRRFTTALLGGLALVALLLAVVGVYALVSFSVGRRVQEFGVRIALGAEPARILRLVFGQGLRLALAGVAVGVTGALLAGRLLDALLFEVSSRDPASLGFAAGLLVGSAVLACAAPAWKALRVDPVSALRQ